MGLFLFIAGIVLVIIAGWVVYTGVVDKDGRWKGAGAVIAVIGLMLFGLSFASKVDARSVGIQTSLGKYEDTLDSGIHATAPWSDVEQWTTRNQTLRFAGSGGGDRDNYKAEPFITVRLGNQSEAYVDVTITWTVGDAEKDKAGIEGLWRQYKTFEDMRHDYATPAAQGAVNAAFDGYNPFAALNDKTADNPYISLGEWSTRITDKLRSLYEARGLHLVSVQATKVAYDKRTEDKLREYADAVANTRIAAQNVETAKKEAEASAARKAQSGNDCLSLIRDLAAQDKLKDLPAGTNVCGGTGTPVIVGGK